MVENKAAYRFFPGCRYGRCGEFDRTRARTEELLRFVGVSLTSAPRGECLCSGYPLFALDRRSFRDHIRRLAPGGEAVDVSSCPLCCFALTTAHREDAVHTVQLLARHVQRFRELPFASAPVMVTYHDPCYLARGLGVTEEPRTLLACLPGVTLVEMGRSRENTFCCGMGGGIEHAFPEVVAPVARQRAAEARETGARLCVTCCPSCLEALAPAGQEVDMEVMDLVDFLFGRLGAG